MARCNPFGYATDAGPRHLMGGMYGPEYAGRLTLLADGIHGPGVCERRADGRWRMICDHGHQGPVMDLCQQHVSILTARYSATCTTCAIPPQQIEIEEQMNHIMRQISGSADRATQGRLRARLDDLRQASDELITRGIIRPRQRLRLVGVS